MPPHIPSIEVLRSDTEDVMLSRDHNGKAGETIPPLTDSAASNDDEASPLANEAVTVAATVGVVAVGVALFEVALLPGMAIGVAAMLAPKYVPKMGEALTPMFKSTVRGVYKFGQKTREMVAARKIEEEANFLAEHSDAAKAVVDFCKHWAREIKVASGNLVHRFLGTDHLRWIHVSMMTCTVASDSQERGRRS